LPEEIEEVVLIVATDRVWLPKVLVEAGLAASTSEGRRLISQGGVQVDGEKLTEVNAEIQAGQTFLLQVGKRRFKRVTLSTDK
jgi:tyrosyl-tRNA synthetase